MPRKEITVEVLPSNEAAEKGFATFNNKGEHVCVELPQATATITVKTADDELVTFSFVQRPQSGGKFGHQCVDIVHHGLARNESGSPLQAASFLGQGPTNAVTSPKDESPTTIVVLSIPHKEHQVTE